jgi:hypothetical protein
MEGPKMWNELNDTEKIERTREQVKYLQERCIRLERRLELLYKHKHDGDRLVQELKYWEDPSSSCISSIGGMF